MKKIQVMLADDHALLRAGIRSLLKDIPEIDVIAEASDGREALLLIGKLRPNVVLMDLAMAGMNGLEATMRVAQEYPDVRTIILSMHASEEYIMRALRAGAAGYMLKDADLDQLANAIKTVAGGEIYLSPSVSKRSITDYLSDLGEDSGQESKHFEPLTPRQREILQLIAEGHTTKKIASMLSISAKTVEVHRAQLMARLKIYDIPGLVRYAIRAGLVAPESPP